MNKRAMVVQRPLVCAAASFALGIALGVKWMLPVWAPMLAGAVFSALLTVWFVHLKRHVIVGVCFLVFFLGLLYGAWTGHPAMPPEGVYIIEGRIEGQAEQRETDGRVKAVLQNVRLIGADGQIHRVKSAYWTYYPAQEGGVLPVDGQDAVFEGKLYHPDGQLNPFGFDFRMYLLQKGVIVGVSGARDLSLTPTEQAQPADRWLRAKLNLSRRMDDLFGAGSGLPKALLLGERTDIDEDTLADFRDAGIAHILAISGLHISLMMGIFLFCLRLARVPVKVQFWIILIVLIVYCRFLSFSASVIRASVMTCVLLFSRTHRRQRDSLTSLAAAFVLVLILRPLDLFSVGFQLSFLAVLGLILLGDRLRTLLKERGRFIDKVVAAYSATVAATAFTAVPSINTFHRFSLVSFLAGPLAIAYVGILLTLYLVVIFLAALWYPAAQVLVPWINMLTGFFTRATDVFASLPYAVINAPHIAAWWTAAIYAGFFLLSRYTLFAAKKKWISGAAMLMLCVALTFVTQTRGVKYTQFAVGNADAAVIEDGSRTYVIDAGDHGGDLAGYLMSTGREVDALFITHLHQDHVGGIVQLLEARVPIHTIFLPSGALKAREVAYGQSILELAANAGIPVREISAGETMQGDKVNMRVLWPYEERSYPGLDANDNSMVLLWRMDGVDLISTGDLSGTYEHYAAFPAQMLKVAHHGSKTATGAAFLERINPQIAFISSAASNERATAEVEQRLQNVGCAIYTTQETGAIMAVANDGTVSLRNYAAKRGAFREN